MLDTFKQHGLQATFFVEALQSAYFGDAPMGGVAQRLLAAGHDVQLHLHPVWTYFDHGPWRQRLASVQPNDDLHGRSVDQLVTWMQRGISTFQRWGVPAPVALRTGNLMVDRNVYRAMAQVGLQVASNVSRAVFEPAEEQLRFNAGIRSIEGIVELPVLTYADLRLGGKPRTKALTVTGSSAAEVRSLLDRAHAARAPAVVLLTHCHEFVKGDMRGALLPDRVNQSRLQATCRYLQDHADRFEVTTMNRMVGWQATSGHEDDPLLAVPAHLAALRMVQNKLNDLNWL
jgi:peptidoglycan/xylan/chitin deacetylase (PgdA/CDA1 family)